MPFIRTLGLAGLLIPLVSIAAALTLQPVLLSLCGRRALRRQRARRPRREPWAALARAIMRRPLAVLLPTAALLFAAAAPIFALHLAPGSFSSLPATTEATRGFVALSDAFGPGALTPTEVVVDAGRARRSARAASPCEARRDLEPPAARSGGLRRRDRERGAVRLQ